MEQLINITDAVFLGHVGEVELGASALAGIYYLVTYMLGFGFSIGLQVMIACRNGEQNYAETGRTFICKVNIDYLCCYCFVLTTTTCQHADCQCCSKKY